MKFFLCLFLSIILFGCEKPQPDSKDVEKEVKEPESVKVNTNKLWTYLKDFRGKEKMPTLDELKKQFGEPDSVVVNGETVNAKSYKKKQAVFLEFNGSYEDDYYYNFKDDEEWVKVSKWIYFHEKNENRIIQIFFRDDKSICGWDWFENVPQDQILGPPK
ncbi:MAG: hypothetical protein NE328_03310 [Lentisphaeraceae bacterium]|nr:hypothetical protein [Lentisphaeraceae bacterium]